MSRKVAYPFIVVCVVGLLWYLNNSDASTTSEALPETATQVDPTKEFDATFLPSSTTGVVVHHDYYSLSYSETHEQAEWVAYALKESDLS